jgi:hypothetical protein
MAKMTSKVSTDGFYQKTDRVTKINPEILKLIPKVVLNAE